MTATAALLLLAWVAIVLLALALGGVVSQLRAVQATVMGQAPRIQEPVVGTLADEEGQAVAPPYVAVFVTPGCASCGRVVPAVVDVVASGGAVAPVFVVSDQVYPSEGVSGEDAVALLVDADAASRFGVPAFPWLVVVDTEGNAVVHEAAHDPDIVTEHIRGTSPMELSERRTL